MSPAQRNRYWRLWGRALAAAWQKFGRMYVRRSRDCLAVEIEGLAYAAAYEEQRAVTADDLRHAAHRVALGRDRSSSRMSNRDLDRVWALFRLLTDPLDLEARIEWEHPERGERRRLEAVVRTAVPEGYARHVAHGKFGTRDFESLDDRQTRELALTLRQRGQALAAEPF